MKRHRLALAICAVIALSQLAAAASTPPPVAGTRTVGGTSGAIHNPRHNIAPNPDFFRVCATQGHNDPTCIDKALEAIRNARSGEAHLVRHRMILPRNFRRLSVPEQTFVISNLERVDRGLRPFKGLTRQLNGAAHDAAVAGVDPALPASLLHDMSIDGYGSNWADDYGPLAANYDWMYYDGYSRSAATRINDACTAPDGRWCWGHRENILSTYWDMRTLMSGVGTASPEARSIAQVFATSSKPRSKFVYTWKEALAHGAAGHR